MKRNRFNTHQAPKRVDPSLMLGITVKEIKKSLPKACTYLSPYKTNTGEYYIRAVINGEDWLYPIPSNFILTQAYIEKIKEEITNKC